MRLTLCSSIWFSSQRCKSLITHLTLCLANHYYISNILFFFLFWFLTFFFFNWNLFYIFVVFALKPPLSLLSNLILSLILYFDIVIILRNFRRFTHSYVYIKIIAKKWFQNLLWMKIKLRLHLWNKHNKLMFLIHSSLPVVFWLLHILRMFLWLIKPKQFRH